MQESVAVRDAMNNAFETTVGASPTLELRTGAAPANCAAADSGTLVCTMTLPSDWLTASSSGTVSKNGTWTGTAGATGTLAHYRIKSSGGTCHQQGTVTASGGGGDMIADNTSVTSGQTVTITAYSRTRGNA